MKQTQATPRVRTLVAFGALGFAVQQVVSMGLGVLGIVHSHYEIELGPHLRGWPAPPGSARPSVDELGWAGAISDAGSRHGRQR